MVSGRAEKPEVPVLLSGQPTDASDVKAGSVPPGAATAGIAQAEGNPTPAVLDAVAKAVRQLELRGADNGDMNYVSHRILDLERQQVLATSFPQCAGTKRIVAIVVKDPRGALKELITMVNEGEEGDGVSLELVTGSCQITFEDVTPSECVEYAFEEEPDQWAVAQITRDALESYRSMKFDAWKQMLLHGTCEAQLRRMLQIGLVTRLYDEHVFPTPESHRSEYQVVDEKSGKVIKVPHPVSALRIWDPAALRYKPIDPVLAGAPPEEEKQAWWEGMLHSLQDKMGADYINSFLKEPLQSNRTASL